MSDKGNAWLVGFIEKCADAGLNVQEIETLIKLSAQDRLFEDHNFSAGFEEKLASEGLDKEAFLGKLLLGGLGAAGGIQAYKRLQSNPIRFGDTPGKRMERSYNEFLEAQEKQRKAREAYDKDYANYKRMADVFDEEKKKKRGKRRPRRRDYGRAINYWRYPGVR